jgi:hypothetical protein
LNEEIILKNIEKKKIVINNIEAESRMKSEELNNWIEVKGNETDVTIIK